MNIKFLLFTFFSFTIFSSSLLAQEKKEDKKKTKIEANKIWNLDVLGAIDYPAADMAKRFGTSYRIGLGIKLKTTTNWIFGAIPCPTTSNAFPL